MNEQAKSTMDLLIKQSDEAEIDISDKFYSEFKQVRKILFNHIVENNPNFDKKLFKELTSGAFFQKTTYRGTDNPVPGSFADVMINKM